MDIITAKVPMWLNNSDVGYYKCDDGSFKRIVVDNTKFEFAKLIVDGDDVSIKFQFPGCKMLTDVVYRKREDGLMNLFKMDSYQIRVSLKNKESGRVVYSTIARYDDGKIRTSDEFYYVDKDGAISKVKWVMEDGIYDYNGRDGFVVDEDLYFSEEENASWYKQPVVDGKREQPLAESMKIPQDVIEGLRERFKALEDFANANNIKLIYYTGSNNIEAVKTADGYNLVIDERGPNRKAIPWELCYGIGQLYSCYDECSDYIPMLDKIQKEGVDAE